MAFEAPQIDVTGPTPRWLKPNLQVWDKDTKLPTTSAPAPKQVNHSTISDWVDTVLSQLDAPEVLVPEINCAVRPWETDDPNHEKCRLLIQTPVEYSASIANMGVAIIYDIVNGRNSQHGIAERAYYPEPKLKKRLLKKEFPLFSKETRHSIKDFDVIAFSSFYPLQMLAFPELLEMGGIPAYNDERTESDPIVVLAGVSAFNPAPVHNVCDVAAVGEGEDQVVDMLRISNEERNGPSPAWKTPQAAKAGWTEENTPTSAKERTFIRWATETDGIYVFKYYDESYHPVDHPHHPGQCASHFVRPQYKDLKGPNGKKLPLKIKKAIIDVNKVKPLTKMFVSNSEGEAMSAGSLMIANSCSNKCYFCQGSYISQPYRERDIEILKEGFTNLIQETGAHAVTPYAFNLSDHSKINELVYFLMNDENRKVSMSSQRIDYFSSDFARAAFLSGNKSITLAVEGGSQRMRDVISKNLTEGMILEAFRTVFEIGFQRVKIYMIANLPGETDEDRYAIVHLLRKIQSIQNEVQGDRHTTQIRISYTPFTAKNWTPFQWAKSLDCDQDSGLPIVGRNLSKVIEDTHEMGYKFRIGTNSDLSIINQCITHGDRRLAPIMMSIYRSPSLNYAGGMSVGKDPLEEVQGFLHNVGLDYEYFMREKPDDELFPWDFINARITKRFLLDMWHRSQAEQNVAICFDDCTKCGACTPESVRHFNSRKEGTLEPDRGAVADALNYKPKPVLQKMRVRFSVNDRFRFVHGSKIKMRLRRAALRCGLPIKNEFILASDKIVFQDWLAGTDYAEVALFSKVIDADTTNLAQKFTEACDGILTVHDIRVYSNNASNFRTTFSKVLYEVFIPEDNAHYNSIKKLFKETLAQETFIVKIKQKGLARDSWEVIEYEARPHIHSLTATKTKNGTQCHMVLSDKLGPYELLPAIFKTSKRRVLNLVARRIDMLEDMNADEDMLAAYCELTGSPIETNLFGEPISDNRAAIAWGLSTTEDLQEYIAMMARKPDSVPQPQATIQLQQPQPQQPPQAPRPQPEPQDDEPQNPEDPTKAQINSVYNVTAQHLNSIINLKGTAARGKDKEGAQATLDIWESIKAKHFTFASLDQTEQDLVLDALADVEAN